MNRWLLVSLALALLVSLSVAQAEAQTPGNKVTNTWGTPEAAVACLKAYFDRMGTKYEVDTTDKYSLLAADFKMEHATHRLKVLVDSDKHMVYVFLNRYLTAKPANPRLAQILQRLMEENWALNIGKFEWDKTDGEVRLSYMFTTENGVGYEAFEAIVVTVVETGDRLWPELHALVGE